MNISKANWQVKGALLKAANFFRAASCRPPSHTPSLASTCPARVWLYRLRRRAQAPFRFSLAGNRWQVNQALHKQLNGDERDRTANPRLAKPVLSQLSYVPALKPSNRVGAPRFELGTSALSGLRSNQLSYAPACTSSGLSRLSPAFPLRPFPLRKFARTRKHNSGARSFPVAYKGTKPFQHAQVCHKRESGILWLQIPLSNAPEPLKRTSGFFRRREARVCRFSSRVTTEKIGMIGSCCHVSQAENNGRAWAAHGLGARGASTSSCGRRRRFEGGRPT